MKSCLANFAEVRALSTLILTLFIVPTVHVMASEEDRRPNIIFILTDDQWADSLGCMGNPVVKTPHLDRLAVEGTLFLNATVTSTICTPSRASFFTGQFERTHGINFNSGTAMSKEAYARHIPTRFSRPTCGNTSKGRMFRKFHSLGRAGNRRCSG